jgi:asparagine synthetase B (glutamine-hydrolysing)
MCGIFAAISKVEAQGPNAELLALLSNRGPDLCGTVSATTKITNGDTVSLKFVSTVLALRGDHIASQPLTHSETRSVLCWNGEAWKIGQDIVEDNDGEAIIRLLSTKASAGSVAESINGVFDVLRSISGPFAFVYYDKFHGLVYFGRDCLGRRSLLYNTDDIPNSIQFSSIADTAAGSWKEVEADGIYLLVLDNGSVPLSLSCLEESSLASTICPSYRYPWVPGDSQGITPVSSYFSCAFNIS